MIVNWTAQKTKPLIIQNSRAMGCERPTSAAPDHARKAIRDEQPNETLCGRVVPKKHSVVEGCPTHSVELSGKPAGDGVAAHDARGRDEERLQGDDAVDGRSIGARVRLQS